MFGDFPHHPEEDSVREAQWEGWTPPWAERGDWRGPRHEHHHGPHHEHHEHHEHHGWHHGPWQHGPWHRGWRGPRAFFFGPGRQWNIPEELLALRIQAAEVARLFAIASRGAFGNKERVAQLRALLDRTHKDLAEIIYGSSSEPSQAQSEPDSAPETGEA